MIQKRQKLSLFFSCFVVSVVGFVGMLFFSLMLSLWGSKQTFFFEKAWAQTSKPSPSYAACSAYAHRKQWPQAQRCFCALYHATNEPYHLKNLAKIQTFAAIDAEKHNRCSSTSLVLRQQAIASYRAYRSFLQKKHRRAMSSTESEQIALSVRQLRAAIRDVRVSFPADLTGAWLRETILHIEGATVDCVARYPALSWTCRSKVADIPMSQSCFVPWKRKDSFVRQGQIWLPSGCYRTTLHAPFGEKAIRRVRFFAPPDKDYAAIQWPRYPRPKVALRLPPTRRKEGVTTRPAFPKKDNVSVRALWIASGISVGLGVLALAGGFALRGVGQGALEEAKRLAYKETVWRASYDQALQVKEAGRVLWITSGGFAALGVGLGIAALLQRNVHSIPTVPPKKVIHSVR